MTLHVVGDEIEFVPQPALELGEHVSFFLARIIDAATSPLHKFADQSPTKLLLESIASDERGFLEGAQELSRRFAGSHGGNNSNGAFFVLELSNGIPNERIFCLIKYDYREAVELEEVDGKHTLRTIVQAFIRERGALQKACLIKVRDGVADLAVSAIDRMGKAPDLTKYYATFLDVERDRSNDELSKTLNEAIRKTLNDCKQYLPDQDVAEAIKVTKTALRGQANVNLEAIKAAVLVAAGMPDDEAIVADLDKRIVKQLKTFKLDGLEFRPDQRIFYQSAPKRRLKTAEDVEIVFPGELENNKVKKERLPDGGWRITITTAESLVEDATLPGKVR